MLRVTLTTYLPEFGNAYLAEAKPPAEHCTGGENQPPLTFKN